MEVFPNFVIEKVTFGSTRLTAPYCISIAPTRDSYLYAVLGRGAWFHAPATGMAPLWCPPGSLMSVGTRFAHSWRSDLEQALSEPLSEFPLDSTHLPTNIAPGTPDTTFLVGRTPIESLQVFVAVAPTLYIPAKAKADVQRVLDHLARIDVFLNDKKKNFATQTAIHRLSEILVLETTRYWMKTAPDSVAFPLMGSDEPHIFRALKALHGKLDYHWTTNDLAKAANLSRSVFGSRFKKTTGKAPLEYLRYVRLRTARLMMGNEDSTLAEISYAVGYGSEASFIRAFRREFKMTPGEFKRHQTGI